MTCLTPERERLLRKLYAIPHHTKLEQKCHSSECKIYADGYNIAYCSGPGQHMYYGNPIRDRFGTDRRGYAKCGPQWLDTIVKGGGYKDYNKCQVSVEEQTEILDSLAILNEYARNCPECIEMLQGIMSGTGRFNKSDAKKFDEWMHHRFLDMTDMGRTEVPPIIDEEE